jgi:hypothetical protein
MKLNSFLTICDPLPPPWEELKNYFDGVLKIEGKTFRYEDIIGGIDHTREKQFYFKFKRKGLLGLFSKSLTIPAQNLIFDFENHMYKKWGNSEDLGKPLPPNHEYVLDVLERYRQEML